LATIVDEDRGSPAARVLVVEDFEPFRQFICSKLRENPGLRLVCEVSDGLEAVRKAEELQPDLLLLDFGLPTMNGIEAARQIRKLAPNSKIVFVSQESSAEVVREAFHLGALGYVAKTDAGSDLLTAVSAALRGETFASSRFADPDFTGPLRARPAESVRRDEVFTPLQPINSEITRFHEAVFYSDDRRLLDELTQFAGAALEEEKAVIIVATESHCDSLLARLQAYGSHINAAIEEGRYISLDAAHALSTFMVNGMPDPIQFVELFGSLIATAAEAAKVEKARVAVFGECVHLLWAQGNAEAAIQIEKLTNQLAQTYDVDILCGYSMDGVPGGMDSHIFQRICAEHSVVHSR
jgi:DNA-binding NarL/FixJ family response regulator